MGRIFASIGLGLSLILVASYLTAEEESLSQPEQSEKGTLSQPTEEQFEKAKRLVGELGDDNWQVREQATKDLTRMGEIVEPLIKEAMKSDDPEIQARAKVIWKNINSFAVLRSIWEEIVPGKPVSSKESTKEIEKISELLTRVRKQEGFSKKVQVTLEEIFLTRLDTGSIEESDMHIRIRGNVVVVGNDNKGPVSGRGVSLRTSMQLEKQYQLLTKIKTQQTSDKAVLHKKVGKIRETISKCLEELAKPHKYDQLTPEDKEVVINFIIKLCGIDKELLDNCPKDQPESEESSEQVQPAEIELPVERK